MGVVSELEKGEVDLVIGCFGELPGGMRRATLYQEEEAIVAICKPHFTVVPPQACQSALVSEGSCTKSEARTAALLPSSSSSSSSSEIQLFHNQNNGTK